jgi:hypothetical protein
MFPHTALGGAGRALENQSRAVRREETLSIRKSFDSNSRDLDRRAAGAARSVESWE